MLNPEQIPATTVDDSEAVQVLTIRGNRIYLSRDIRMTFNLRDGDKIIVYSASGDMRTEIIRRARAMDPAGLAHRPGEIR